MMIHKSKSIKNKLHQGVVVASSVVALTACQHDMTRLLDASGLKTATIKTSPDPVETTAKAGVADVEAGYIRLGTGTDVYSHCPASNTLPSDNQEGISCMGGTYRGHTLDGAECQLEFDSTTLTSTYQEGKTRYLISGNASTEFSYQLQRDATTTLSNNLSYINYTQVSDHDIHVSIVQFRILPLKHDNMISVLTHGQEFACLIDSVKISSNPQAVKQ